MTSAPPLLSREELLKELRKGRVVGNEAMKRCPEMAKILRGESCAGHRC
jgi:hypothetical protein